MRIGSHASEQYRKNAVAEKPREQPRTQPQASVTSTSFGFRLGKFGLDFSSETTVLDPSLSRDVKEQNRQAQAYNAEREVETLRATIGAQGATYRNQEDAANKIEKPSPHQLKSGIAAYTKSAEERLPSPGGMLEAVV